MEPCHANPGQVVHRVPGTVREHNLEELFFLFVCDLCHITRIAFVLSLSYLCSSLS